MELVDEVLNNWGLSYSAAFHIPVWYTKVDTGPHHVWSKFLWWCLCKSGLRLDYERETPGNWFSFRYLLKDVFFQALLDPLFEWFL